MTSQDIILSVQNSRSAMIDTYTPLFVNSKQDYIDDLTDKKEFIESFLFGDGTYLGVDQIIDLYWNQAIYCGTSGSIATNLTIAIVEGLTTWNNTIYDADGDLKSPYSAYITNNGVTSSGNIYDSFITWLGTEASSIGNLTSTYSYASAVDAQIALDLADVARCGTGFLKERTRDYDPAVIEQDPAPPNLWRYNFGNNVVDTPDYWDANIYTYIDNILVSLNNILGTLTTINNFIVTINENDLVLNKTLLTTFDSGLTAFFNSVNAQITTLTNNENTLKNLDDDLTTNRSAINTILLSLKTNIASWKIVLDNRVTAIISGNTIFGLVTTLGTVNHYREQIISSLAAFPNGIIPILNTDQTSTILQLILKDESLLTTYGYTYDKFIPKATMVAVRYNQSETEVNIRWMSNYHQSSFKIYRRLLEEVVDNDEWSESYLLATLTTVDPETGCVQQFYDDTTIDNTKNYCYRIKSIDVYYGGVYGFTASQSEQSDVYSSGSVIERTHT